MYFSLNICNVSIPMSREFPYPPVYDMITTITDNSVYSLMPLCDIRKSNRMVESQLEKFSEFHIIVNKRFLNKSNILYFPSKYTAYLSSFSNRGATSHTSSFRNALNSMNFICWTLGWILQQNYWMLSALHKHTRTTPITHVIFPVSICAVMADTIDDEEQPSVQTRFLLVRLWNDTNTSKQDPKRSGRKRGRVEHWQWMDADKKRHTSAWVPKREGRKRNHFRAQTDVARPFPHHHHHVNMSPVTLLVTYWLDAPHGRKGTFYGWFWKPSTEAHAAAHVRSIYCTGFDSQDEKVDHWIIWS